MNLKEKYREFKEWQKKPYQVKPLLQEDHICATCGTSYQGNYCPRCGQSSRIGRYSLKATLLLFIDVWGLGNRGMFRSIRDLLLRPGYMIRDYLSGMQMAYFPPFKMYFLLTALSILVDSGFNILRENRFDLAIQKYEEGFNMAHVINVDDSPAVNDTIDAPQKFTTSEFNANQTKAAQEFKETFYSTFRNIVEFVYDHEPIIILVWLLAMSLPLYLFFCNSPARPDFRYPEFFVAMVYISNLNTIIQIALGLLCVNQLVIGVLAYISIILALKQLSGYSLIRTFFSHAIATFILFVTCFVLTVIGVIGYGIIIGFGAVQ